MSEDLKILKLCQRIAETFDNGNAINEFGEFLRKNPQFIDSIQNAIKTLQEEQEILEEFEKLKRYDLPQQKISQQGFENFVDDVVSGDLEKYIHTPNIVYLGNLNQNLANSLNLNEAKVYFSKKDLYHSRPIRKGKYRQDLPLDVFKELPSLIEIIQEAYVDLEQKNFFIAKKIDSKYLESLNDFSKNLAIFSFEKDKDGNYIIHTKRTSGNFFRNKRIKKVSPTGVAPAIPHTTQDDVAATSLHASSDTLDEIIPQNSLTSQVNQVNFPNDCGAAFRSIKEIETKRQENLKIMSDMLNKRKEQENNITQTTQQPSVDGADIDTNTSPRGPRR